jgi:hypothetical protein
VCLYSPPSPELPKQAAVAAGGLAGADHAGSVFAHGTLEEVADAGAGAAPQTRWRLDSAPQVPQSVCPVPMVIADPAGLR